MYLRKRLLKVREQQQAELERIDATSTYSARGILLSQSAELSPRLNSMQLFIMILRTGYVLYRALVYVTNFHVTNSNSFSSRGYCVHRQCCGVSCERQPTNASACLAVVNNFFIALLLAKACLQSLEWRLCDDRGFDNQTFELPSFSR